jgi:hypothetical protein
MKVNKMVPLSVIQLYCTILCSILFTYSDSVIRIYLVFIANIFLVRASNVSFLGPGKKQDRGVASAMMLSVRLDSSKIT